MKKIFLRLSALFILFCLVFTGCTAKDGEAEETTDTSEQTTTESGEAAAAANKKITLKVGTYNISYAGTEKDISGKEDLKEVNLKAIADEILKYELEVIGFQEVENECRRSGKKDFMKLLSKYTGYQYYHFGKSMDFDGGAIGTGILSKYPLKNVETIVMSEASEDGYGEPRTVTKASIDVEGVEFLFLNTHLSAKGEETVVRAKQLNKIIDVIGDAERWILTGDFNIENFDEYAPFKIKNCTSIQQRRQYNTKAEGRAQPIDNIFYSKTMEYHRADVSDVKPNNSDHVLLWAYLRYTVPTE